MSSLVKLDDLSLSLILAKLSIQDLWTSGQACARLKEARRNCANVQRELTLLIGHNAKRCEKDSALSIPEKALLVNENEDVMFPDNDQNVQLQIYSFPLDFVRLLLAHFTNLTTLTISNRVNENVDSIIHLLEQFNRPNGTLRELKLYSNYDQLVNEQVLFSILPDNRNKNNSELNNNIRNIRKYLRLLHAVNAIGSLRKLTFDVNAKFVKNAKYPRIDLPILGQLEQFEFNSADGEFVCLRDSITRYGLNNLRLRRIGIHLQTDDFTWLLALPTEFSSRFTHLHIRLNPANIAHFEDFCRHFACLTSLEITHKLITNFSIFQIFRPLTALTNLLSLTLNIDGLFMDSLPPNERGVMHFELPSVMVFTIHLTARTFTHNFIHKCNINRVLPNVQVLRVLREKSLCFVCHFRIDGWTFGDVIELERHCARHMFRHCEQNQHLRVVCSHVVGENVLGARCRKWAWIEMEEFDEVDEDDFEFENENEEDEVGEEDE